MASPQVEMAFRRRWEDRTTFRRIRSGLKTLLGLNTGGRNFPVLPDDTFLVSYPRSGNTWTRFLIANLLFADRKVSFLNIDYLIPDTFNITRRELAKIPRPRLIKSHEYFDPRYKKVIYIVRDPRDVAISYYYFYLKQGFIQDEYPLDKFIRQFVEGAVDPEFASWGENVMSWIATKSGQPGFILLRYEDLKSNTVKELAKLGKFFEVQTDPENLERAVQLSSAERMRELEKREENQWIGTRTKRKDVPFIRTAAAGSWKSLLSPGDIAKIENAWAPIMTALGYGLTTTGQDDADISLPFVLHSRVGNW
jgi:Sulfotransferase domain